MTLLLALLLASSIALADGLESSDARRVGERPDPAGQPTLVKIDVFIFDIDAIDDAAQRFELDIFVNISWQDSRLALPVEERVGTSRILPLAEIWTPRGLIINDRGLKLHLPRVGDVDDLGNVQYRQRLSGPLAVNLQLAKFPFDAQTLPVKIISYQYNPAEVQLSSDAEIAGNSEAFSAEGWRFRILEPEISEFVVPAFDAVRPLLTFSIEAQRISSYYLMTMFLPMSLIIFMSWTVFWIQPDIVPPRIAISTASIFSLMAFGFSIRLSLPEVSYLTRADVFVISCTLLVFLALGVAVIGSRWANADRMPHALLLNSIARWVYAGLFAVVTVTALVY